ncbi:MAG: MazF family transcriptional regulator [Gemmataceae bacterium]|nr:MazF family transcriptional regulator [Gemmataceae bacterium]
MVSAGGGCGVGTPAAGEVALVPFPFSDLSQSKVRPAVCLADAGRGDWVLCQITSSPYGDPAATALDAPDFASGGLLVASFARPGKLFTAHAGLMVRSVGVLTPTAFARVLSAVVAVLQPPASL